MSELSYLRIGTTVFVRELPAHLCSLLAQVRVLFGEDSLSPKAQTWEGTGFGAATSPGCYLSQGSWLLCQVSPSARSLSEPGHPGLILHPGAMVQQPPGYSLCHGPRQL